MNTTADVHCINLLDITYDLNKLRHTSEVKEKTVFITLSNKPCTFENNDQIIQDRVSEGLKVSLEAVVYSKTKKKMRAELFLANCSKFINLTFFHGRNNYQK